jgi:DNA-binding CsgD family transcriptional regulator
MSTLPHPGAVFQRRDIHARDLDQARLAAALAYGEEISLDAGPGAGGFQWDAAYLGLGPMALIPSYYGTRLRAHGVPSAYFVSISHQGEQRTVTRGATAEIVPGRLANVMSPGVFGERTTEARLFSTALRIDPGFLSAELEALTGVAVAGPVVFALSLPIHAGPGAALVELCSFLLYQLEREADPFAHPLVLRSFFETVARVLLLGQPHDHTHLLARPAPPAGPGAVRLAEEYADAHAVDPITTRDLAALAGTSVNALIAGFHAHRGTSPDEVLRKKRLGLARARLRQPGGASLGDVAGGAGFVRRERFEAAYSAEFHESPAETRGAAGGAARAGDAEREALAARLATLSPREREVCVRVAQGMLNKQIAAEMGIVTKTVQVHRGRGMEKLGVGSVADLVRLLAGIGKVAL